MKKPAFDKYQAYNVDSQEDRHKILNCEDPDEEVHEYLREGG
jgi:hypothetical protein